MRAHLSLFVETMVALLIGTFATSARANDRPGPGQQFTVKHRVCHRFSCSYHGKLGVPVQQLDLLSGKVIGRVIIGHLRRHRISERLFGKTL